MRVVGKDALVSLEASLYSVPWTMVRPGQRVELRITKDQVHIYTLGSEPQHLATHLRASRRGTWVVDQSHWDGLPDGSQPHEGPGDAASRKRAEDDQPAPSGAGTIVARRALSTYDALFTKEETS